MYNKNYNALSSYVKRLKIYFDIPNQPNTKHAYRVVGLLVE